MAFWQEQINITYLHHTYSAGSINVVQLAKGVVARLKTTKYYATAEPDFMDVLMEFNAIDMYSSHTDYCIAMDYLNEFGNDENRLWVETMKPTPREDIMDDNRAININVKMFDEYDITPENIYKPVPITKGPYYQSAVPNKSLPIHNGASSCSTPSYSRVKQTRYLTTYEFEQQLKAKGIDPSVLSKDFSNYVKDVNEQFREWILDRYVEIAGPPINPKQAPFALDG